MDPYLRTLISSQSSELILTYWKFWTFKIQIIEPLDHRFLNLLHSKATIRTKNSKVREIKEQNNVLVVLSQKALRTMLSRESLILLNKERRDDATARMAFKSFHVLQGRSRFRFAYCIYVHCVANDCMLWKKCWKWWRNLVEYTWIIKLQNI